MESKKVVKKIRKVENEEKKEEEKKEVIVKEEAGLPAEINFVEDMSGGFENVTSKDFKIPIVRVLQAMSPEVDEDNPKYVEGSKAGSLYNISTKEAFDGKEGIWVIPCAYHKKWVEFVPRDLGGGYVDEYEPNDLIVKKSVKADKGTNKIIKETGNTLTETGYFPCLQVNLEDGTYDEIVITVSSSAWNFAKDWLNVMRKKTIINPKTGRPFPNPPAFWSHMYRVGSKTVKNPQFSWKQFCLLEDKILTNDDVELYMAGKEFNRISGAVKFGADTHDEEYHGSYTSEDDESEY